MRGDGFDHDIAFTRGDEQQCLGLRETISLSLTCSNRELPEQLTIGDVCVGTEKSPTFAAFRNITKPTPVLRPAIDDGLLWVLISNLSLNYLSLLNRDALCAVLKAYDFRALVDRQAERIAQKRLAGIVDIQTQPVDRLRRGLPVRGLRSVMTLDRLEALRKKAKDEASKGADRVSLEVTADHVGMGIAEEKDETKASIYQSLNPAYILILDLVGQRRNLIL